MAAYAAMFAWNRQLGWLGFVVAMVCGTSLSLLLVIAKRSDLPTIAIVAGPAFLGIFLWSTFPVYVTGRPASLEPVTMIIVASFVGMGINLIRRETKAQRADASIESPAVGQLPVVRSCEPGRETRM